MIKSIKVFLIVIIILIHHSCGNDDQHASKNRGLNYSLIKNMLKDFTPDQNNKFREIEKKIKTIKLGMSMDDVKFIMGEPEQKYVHKNNGIIREVWIYNHNIVASTPPKCHFDFKTKKVIAVFSGEDYALISDLFRYPSGITGATNNK